MGYIYNGNIVNDVMC